MRNPPPEPTPTARYPRPAARPEFVERVRSLYRRERGVDLTFPEAKALLEGVMQFAYLTEIEDALRPVREEVERERGPAGPEH